MRVLLSSMFLSVLAVSVAHAEQKPRWGKVVCEAVAQADAVAFANQHHFLDSWDYMHESDPPYVAPKGTFSCTLPVQYTSDTDSDGHVFYTLVDGTPDESHRLHPCSVTYYATSRQRHFHAVGSATGFVDLVPGTNNVNVTFYDNDQTHFSSDEFIAIDIGRAHQIVWIGENQDDRAYQPIVTDCRVEL